MTQDVHHAVPGRVGSHGNEDNENRYEHEYEAVSAPHFAGNFFDVSARDFFLFRDDNFSVGSHFLLFRENVFHVFKRIFEFFLSH